MRIDFYNDNGGIMSVDESRVEEYKAAGYKPVAVSIPEEKTVKTPETKKKRVKK